MKNSARTSLRATLIAVFLGFVSPNAMGAAFYISQIGTPGSVGTAGVANVVNNISADSAFTNPAGMTGLKETNILSGMQLVLPNNQFDSSIAEAGGNDGHNAGIVAAIPSLFIVKPLTERLRLGFSAVAPLGGGVDYGRQFVGRYQATRSVLQGVGLSPSVGYKLTDRLSVGAGVSALYSVLDLKVAVNQSAIGAPDGRVHMDKIDDWSWQGFFGVTYQATDKVLLGMTYRSESDVDLKGNIRFSNVQIPIQDKPSLFKLGYDLVQTVVAGVRFDVTDDLRLFMDANWEDWSEFSNNRVEFVGGAAGGRVATVDRNWKDTWHVGVAGTYKLGPGIVSMGVSYDSSPLKNKDRTADLPMDEQLAFSLAYGRRGEGRWSYALGLTGIYLGKGKMDQVAQGARFKGEFDTNLLFFLAGTLNYRF